MAETTREFCNNPYAGYVDVLPAKRLANAIATVKAVLIGIAYNTAESADLMTPEDSPTEADVE